MSAGPQTTAELIDAATAAGATVIRAHGATVIVIADAPASENSTDPLLTMAEAGLRLKCDGRVIRDAGRRGELDIEHAGRSPRVRASKLERWSESERRAQPVDHEPITSPREAARAAVAARALRIA